MSYEGLEGITVSLNMIDVKPYTPMGEKNKNQEDQNAEGYNSKRIFVGGLPHDLRDEEFKNYFENFGKITDWVVMYDRENNMPRGFGFVTFDSEEAVDDVLRKRFHELNYKSVEAKRAHSKNRNNMLMKPYDCYNLGTFGHCNPYCFSYGASYGYGYRLGYTSDNNIQNFGQYNPYCISYGAHYGYGHTGGFSYGAHYGYGYTGGFVYVPNPYSDLRTPISWAHSIDYGVWGSNFPNSPKSTSRNWTELPDDVTALILSRLGAIEILGTVQKVCMSWRKICKDSLMWHTIDMRNDGYSGVFFSLKMEKICRQAIDRSSGNLVDINVQNFGSDELLKYITNSSPGIKRLRLENCYVTNKGLIEAASKLQLLEDLEISRSPRSYSRQSGQTLEVIGRSCPLLTTFKYNGSWQRFYKRRATNEDALAIAETMHGLRQLQLFGNAVTNDGLAKILDCCPHLESLDLRDCFNLNLGGDLEIRCSKQIKRLQLPDDCPDDDSESTESFGAYDREASDFDFWSGHDITSDSDTEYDDYDVDDDYEFSIGKAKGQFFDFYLK
ncbi:uncharacterized protein LOC112203106 [Rosa chinensis]|uniref:uncharacterized protein LOC112203106 n=1 Tax=Rosa chinensis TaxID=74649 RepID=UPI000D08FD92|nr:uncharacterized protein LOC112203106 [Rosa chinensis]